MIIQKVLLPACLTLAAAPVSWAQGTETEDPQDALNQLAVTADTAAQERVRAFPYAAARVWKLDDVAADIMGNGG